MVLVHVTGTRPMWLLWKIRITVPIVWRSSPPLPGRTRRPMKAGGIGKAHRLLRHQWFARTPRTPETRRGAAGRRRRGGLITVRWIGHFSNRRIDQVLQRGRRRYARIRIYIVFDRDLVVHCQQVKQFVLAVQRALVNPYARFERVHDGRSTGTGIAEQFFGYPLHHLSGFGRKVGEFAVFITLICGGQIFQTIFFLTMSPWVLRSNVTLDLHVHVCTFE